MKNVQKYSIVNYGICGRNSFLYNSRVYSHTICLMAHSIAEAYQDICSHVAGLGYSLSNLPDLEEVERDCRLNREEREKLNDPKYFAYLTLAVS